MAPAADELARIENARFVSERPRSQAVWERARGSMPRGVPMAWLDGLFDHDPVFVRSGSGSRFTDIDGLEYVDFNIADMSTFCGHAPPPVVEAVSAQMRRGNQFLLPTEDAVWVAEHLARRYRMPLWQFTLTATQANVEVIRLARRATGREVVLVFDGKYHGHLDTTLVVVEDGRLGPEYDGLPANVTDGVRVVPFNDVAALRAALAPRDVALVLAEPALTNAGFVLPQPGFLDAVRALTRETETLLAIDETHTLVCSYGGLAVEWGVAPDLLTVGKSIGAGVPLAAYGMTPELGRWFHPDSHSYASGLATGELATGGTLFGNALSMSAGRAALGEVLTPQAFDHTAALGHRLADGLRGLFADHGLSWSVVQHGAHAAYFFTPTPPSDAAAARDADDPELRALIRLYLANRGIWESGWWLGPTVSVAHTETDVDTYLDVFGELLAALR